ncbi:transporter [Variovorax saccharolyticus]|uniref:VirB4 family type IV secretion/conjugal transfer ATPase n=1 Tax=Variovorax saccharolyticus TaxID=3053516 RepID=UPI002575B95F|nr:transporter [Variovorax sp. J31P216]MDM0029125.1 transporter [Variovorax sp. J31P216]
MAGEEHLPRYHYHVRDTILSLEDGRVAFVVQAKGVPFEVTSDSVLENNYDALNDLFLSVAKSTGARLAVWAHLDHFQTQFTTNYLFSHEWMRKFSAGYMAKFAGTDVFENDFYLTFVLKPNANDDLEECIRELEEIQLMVTQSLRMYECEVLGTYLHEGNLFSQVYEFLGYLYNGYWERIPVTSLPAFQVVQSSALHHGYKLMETRFPDGGQQFDALFDLKDFPECTTRGQFNPLLELPFPFVLCLSFTFIHTAAAVKMINQALNKLESAGDEAHEQHDEMRLGKGAIMSGLVRFGELHGALTVRGKTERQAEDRGATARTTLSGSCGALFVPATIAAPETFYSMFPGNARRRPRPMPKTTRNLLGLFSMNTYSSGKQHGNPIGDGSAVMPLRTTVHGVYHLNCHYSIPDRDERGQKRAGHVLILGATGTGKTTAQTVFLAFMERFGAKLFAIDKDGSMRGFIEAHGGTYFRLAAGEPTGLNPFQLPDTPFTREFLYDLVGACGRRKDLEPTAEDTKDIKRAVDTVFEIPFDQRRFSVLLQSIPDRGADCLARRLADWCYAEGDGRYAYALDNPKNDFDWESFSRVGFDVTDFLKAGHPATEPILAYLFHLKALMQRNGGGLLATVVEEFWLPLGYPTTAAQILDVLKTGRRRDEFIFLVSQSPEDVIKSPLLPDILQQTPTKILLPNPDAVYTSPDGGGYARVGLSPKEFQRLRKLGRESRMFLIKQGSQSCIAKLDLHGLEDYIAVMAMAAEDFELLEDAKAQAGNHPDAWVPRFIKLRRARREMAMKAPLTTSPLASSLQERETSEI